MNKTAKKEVESSLNYLNTGLLLAFSLLFFLIILAYPVDALTWPTRTLNCEDTTGDDGGSIDCNWNITDLDSTATGFSLWRKATSNWVTIHSTLKVIDTTFTDVNAQTGTNYKYRLLLFNGTIEDDTWGDESGYTMAQDNNIPTPPNNIIAVDTQNDQGGSISISWDPSDSEAGGSGDNFVKGFRINYNCSSPSIVNENKSLGKIYEWPHEYDITPPRSYGNCTYSMSSYDAGENGSGIRYGGWSSVTEAVNGTDNLPPQPPTGAAAGDILGDDGKLGININWTRSVDEIEVESGADDIQGYYVIAMTAESGQNWTNIIIDGPVAATVASIIGSETTPFDTSVNNNLTIMYTNGDGDAEICNVEFTQNFSYATVTGDSLGGFDFTLNNTLNLTYTNNTVEESCSVEFVGVTMSTTVTASSIRAVCNITATNSSGYLKLETKNIGSDEFINLTGGNATNMLGFQINNKYYGNNGFTIEDAISNITGSPGNCDLYATKVDGKLKLTTKTLGAETFIIISGTATSVFGLDTNVHEGTDAYTSPGYLVAKGGPYSISFQNGSNGITIGSSSSPWNVNSYFNTTLFYFYIKSYDGTFNSTGTSIVSAAFNGRPYIKALDLDPLKGFTQTEDNIVCTAFVCDPNNDEVTSKYKFTVAAFAGGGNYEEEGDATCINMGPISGNSTIQKNYGKDIGCNPGIVEIPDSWECMAVLPNTFTFKGNKITCAQTPNDGKEEGDTLDNTMNDPDNITHPYPINNTAPIASNAYIYPPAPLGNDTLTCKYTYSDIDLDSESNDSINEKTTAFKWYINNEGLNTFVEIPDKTSKTLDEYFDQNDKVMCSINVCDYDGSWLKNSLCYNERSWFNESGVADTVEATAAYIIGSKTTTFDTNPNNALSITHTNSTGGSEICTVTLSTNNTLTITEAINNITGSPGNCDLAATSVDGKLKLTTKTSGAGTFIIISGTATSEFGFDTIVHGGTDAYDLLGAWTWLTGTSYYEYENSTTTIIGGNSIPQLISYSDDSNATLPTDVGSQVTFNATWLDTDANELARIMVCEKEGEPDDYDCDGQNCTGSIDFGDNGNNAWIYTNQTGLMIDTIEIKIKSFTLNGTTNSVENATTPFIFSIIAYEADNITSTLPPTSTVPDYYEAQTMRIARSDWNSLTNNQWITLTLQYNAQPLSDKYTALKFCIATEQDGIAGSDLGGTGYVISNIEQNTNWFNSMINWFGKIFRSLFKITGYAATSYVDTCFEAGDFYKNRTGGTSASVGALNNTETRDIAYDNSRWYDYVNIRINYKSVGINGSCPGDKTYCETEFSPEIDQSCSYTPTDSDNTTVKYNIRVCDDELACSIWRYGYFSVNHPAKLDWVTIGTNYLSYEEGLTYSSDVNDDWNLQCIQGTASDKDLANTITSDIIIDADGWTTVFADIQNEKDPNLENGTSLIECSSDTKLRWIDVNDGDGDYDYEIDTLIHTTGGVILQFSNVSGGTGNIFSSSSTEATVTGTIKGPFNTSSNNILKLGYTVNGVTYSCDVTLNQSDSTSTDTIVTNITTQCTGGGGITATNSTGYLKLTTTGTGSDEHIDIRSGNAIGTLGFETGKTYGTDASNCYFHDKNNDGNYDSGEDIIWDETAFNSVFDENINFTYQWFVKPFGDTEFKSCDDFLWCDNDYNDILTHGNTMPGDRWLCQI